ncbi:hypothetical protein QP324_08995 [Corynebacterium sp. UMB0012]|uniref:hypothetical protein n=1 Tax=Corynebacterium sp. UMB0012 TaxID=3046344 RepID=UPI00254EB9BC|nr:hypothetical protein [Corynebacterium sp. UMB0012]MDK7048710.1 hypothetical protein [Corynebacterium sp. UMB0012]
MTKTLADLAPHDRADYVGMWVDVPHKPHPVAYMGDFESTGEIKYGAVIFDPRYGTNYERLDDCALRPDLARAWNPDGTPPAGEWECAKFLSHYQGMSGVYVLQRRFVSEWEEA